MRAIVGVVLLGKPNERLSYIVGLLRDDLVDYDHPFTHSLDVTRSVTAGNMPHIVTGVPIPEPDSAMATYKDRSAEHAHNRLALEFTLLNKGPPPTKDEMHRVIQRNVPNIDTVLPSVIDSANRDAERDGYRYEFRVPGDYIMQNRFGKWAVVLNYVHDRNLVMW